MNVIGQIRAATPADAEAILRLNLLVDLAEVGEPNTTIDEVRGDLATDDLHNVVVEDPAGGLAGYAWAYRVPNAERVWGDYIVRPGGEPAIVRVLFGWLRKTAAEIGPGLPLHVFADSENTMKRRLYEEAGAEVVRRFYRMAIVFDAPPPEPADLGADVVIRPVTDDEADLRTMHEVVDVSFIDHFAHERESFELWRQHTADGANRDLSLWWLATVAGQPAAGLYGAEMPGKGYVDTLGTLREYRGRGLGRALLLTAFGEFYRRGQTRVVLGVDSESPTGALGLYESVGMTIDRVGLRYELLG